MPMAPSKFIPYEMKTNQIKVHSYKGKNLTGIFSNPYFEKEIYFENTIQLLFLIDFLQNEIQFPQESMDSRTFKKGEGIYNPNFVEDPAILSYPVLAHFKVNILFRQNASWQGSIGWVEQGTEAQFRSVLELIMLIDSVLADTG